MAVNPAPRNGGEHIMEHYITLAELTQIGIFLVSFVSLLYAIFHNNEKRK